MVYITNGVFRSLPKEVIEHELKKFLIGSRFKISDEYTIIDSVSYFKNNILLGFLDTNRTYQIEKVKKIELSNISNTVSIFSSSAIYTIDMKK